MPFNIQDHQDLLDLTRPSRLLLEPGSSTLALHQIPYEYLDTGERVLVPNVKANQVRDFEIHSLREHAQRERKKALEYRSSPAKTKATAQMNESFASYSERQATNAEVEAERLASVPNPQRFPVEMREMPLMGRILSPGAGQENWLKLINALRLTTQPGGPLDGWVFHGTLSRNVDNIIENGLVPSFAMYNDDQGESIESKGCHFGTPAVAAFFGEDFLEEDWLQGKRFNGDELALVAVKVADLLEIGRLVEDGQMMDFPLESRYAVERSADDLWNEWSQSGKTWEDSLRLYEAFVLLGDVPADKIKILKSLDDVRELIDASRLPQKPAGTFTMHRFSEEDRALRYGSSRSRYR